MDVKYINPFMASVQNVFKTMLSLDVQFGKPSIRQEPEVSHDVTGIIGLSGDVVGAVILSFPKLSALKLASHFAGAQLELNSEDFADAIGELANMVAGNAKKDLEGMKVSISTPSVIIGPGHTVRGMSDCPRLMIPVSTGMGSFVVEVGMRLNNGANNSQNLVTAGA